MTESDERKNLPNIPLFPEALTASLIFLNSKANYELYDSGTLVMIVFRSNTSLYSAKCY